MKKIINMAITTGVSAAAVGIGYSFLKSLDNSISVVVDDVMKRAPAYITELNDDSYPDLILGKRIYLGQPDGSVKYIDFVLDERTNAQKDLILGKARDITSKMEEAK